MATIYVLANSRDNSPTQLFLSHQRPCKIILMSHCHSCLNHLREHRGTLPNLGGTNTVNVAFGKVTGAVRTHQIEIHDTTHTTQGT